MDRANQKRRQLGLVPIGHRMPMIEHTPLPADSASPRFETTPSVSTRTSPPGQAGTNRILDGPGATVPGETGSGMRPLGDAPPMTPAEIDGSLEAWLPRQVASSIEPVVHDPTTMGSDPERNWSVIGWRVGSDHEENAGREAIEMLRRLNLSCGLEFATKELVRIKMLTKAAKQDDMDTELLLGIMAEELADYPADVVRDSCRFYTKRNKWFPSWSELQELCEERALKRRVLLNALRRYWNG